MIAPPCERCIFIQLQASGAEGGGNYSSHQPMCSHHPFMVVDDDKVCETVDAQASFKSVSFLASLCQEMRKERSC